MGELLKFGKPWLEEADWLVLIEFLRRDDQEDRARGAEAIGYMLHYARMTGTRMLALVGDHKEDVYELLFSFASPEGKAQFLWLLQSNDATAYEDEEILVPHPSEIKSAQPIETVLPSDVLHRVHAVAAMPSDRDPSIRH
jgi:hypothetical protein